MKFGELSWLSPRATLTLLSCSLNILHASLTHYMYDEHEPLFTRLTRMKEIKFNFILWQGALRNHTDKCWNKQGSCTVVEFLRSPKFLPRMQKNTIVYLYISENVEFQNVAGSWGSLWAGSLVWVPRTSEARKSGLARELLTFEFRPSQGVKSAFHMCQIIW